jgi:hypothetical protein
MLKKHLNGIDDLNIGYNQSLVTHRGVQTA